MGSVIGGIKKLEEMDMSSPLALDIKNTIKENKIVIYSKSYCPYCVMAKEQFQKLAQAFVAIELDLREDGNEMQDILAQMTGARSVPRVFVNGNFIGGGTDVKAMYSDGSLKKLLQN